MRDKTITWQTIDALLPQTQCGDCDYAGCEPYAKAIVNGDAINKCLPGGVSVLQKLGEVLQQDISPYLEDMQKKAKPKRLALIREAECIGCTKCIQACPVDAIMGAAKLMHTVIQSECTGCTLCIEPCPMDCIDLVDTDEQTYASDKMRQRYHTRLNRLARIDNEKKQKHQQAKTLDTDSTKSAKALKKAEIMAAIARSKAKRDHSHDT